MRFIFSLIMLSVGLPLSANTQFIPEASAITKVGSTFVVAGDEEPKHLWLISEPTQITKTAVSGGEWNDLEGLATLDQKSFYAITSHGLTKKGKRKAEREQLMLISLAPTLTITRSWSLRESILHYLEQHLAQELDIKQVSSAIPDEGGLNIEGLTYQQGKLFIGLRSPVTKSGEALILVLSVQDHQKIQAHYKLNLEGRGIRSLESSQDQLLVISGSANDNHEKFGLHNFSLITNQLSAKKAAGFEHLLRPEGVASAGHNSLLIVQDFEAEENQAVLQQLSTR